MLRMLFFICHVRHFERQFFSHLCSCWTNNAKYQDENANPKMKHFHFIELKEGQLQYTGHSRRPTCTFRGHPHSIYIQKGDGVQQKPYVCVQVGRGAFAYTCVYNINALMCITVPKIQLFFHTQPSIFNILTS